MSSWSLRWRILAEVIVLVVVTTVAAVLFEVPGAVFVGILAVAAGAYRARLLSSLFSKMTEDVLRTASIDRSHRISPVGPAELSRMARAVNRLADRLVRAMRDADKERARLELILESMADGVMLVDEDGIVEFANPAAIHLLGDEADYKPGVRLITINNSFELNELATGPARSGNASDAQLEMRPSGKTVRGIASPLDDRGGRRKSVVLLTDMTAVKLTETTRREFVSNASHELRTPIAAIKASAETLQHGAAEDPDARRDFLARILEDSDRIEQMVREMLELSRLESGQTPLDIQLVDATQFLNDTSERFRPLASQSNIEITVDVAENSLLFRADKAKFEQVFSNLITNAMKAMPEGGEIILSARIEDGGTLLLEVRDNGPGIQASHHPHLFERFYKVDSSRSDAGSGLGLAIARHIVQLHDGEISVDSKVGEGTTFSISMECANSSERAQTATRP